MGALWDHVINTFQTYTRGSCDVTKRTLSLGLRDGVTGWAAKTYVDSTVKMVIIPQGATKLALACGTFARLDAVGLTDTVFLEGDEVKTAGGKYYEVEVVREFGLTPDVIEYYECDLTRLPLHV